MSSHLSFHLIPTIDKPTRLHNTSATPIFRTDYFSQFCISRHPTSRGISVSPKVGNYSNFYLENFNNELTQINWDVITLDCLDTHQDNR